MSESKKDFKYLCGDVENNLIVSWTGFGVQLRLNISKL